MERFQFTSRLTNGMDIKTAGGFVKEAIRCSGKVTIHNGARTGDAKLIFNVMSLNIKEGDVIEIEINGGNEAEDAASLKSSRKSTADSMKWGDRGRSSKETGGGSLSPFCVPALPQMKPCTRGGLIYGGAGSTGKVV